MKDKATVETVYDCQPSASAPTLLKFQNGSLVVINKEKTKYCRMAKTDGKRGALVVASDQVFHGLMEEEQTDMYICVRNKTTNKVRIVPIEQVSLNNHIYNELNKPRLTALSKENAMKKMLKEFGGRSASRYLSRKENLKVDVEVFKKDIEATVQESNIPDDILEPPQTERHLDDIRPPFNKEAKDQHEVYNIADVVPQELLERLEEEAKAVYSSRLEKLPIKSEFLLKCIETIQKSTVSKENFLKIKLIIYMDCLLNLVSTRARIMKNRELSGITEKVETDVRLRFCDPNSKNSLRTAQSSEKALCYFIVLALLISDNFEVDLNVLTQELRSPRRKIVKYAHIVHARPKTKSDILVLRLPSKMPPVPLISKRRTI